VKYKKYMAMRPVAVSTAAACSSPCCACQRPTVDVLLLFLVFVNLPLSRSIAMNLYELCRGH